jgi:hypothetical protein
MNATTAATHLDELVRKLSATEMSASVHMQQFAAKARDAPQHDAPTPPMNVSVTTAVDRPNLAIMANDANSLFCSVMCGYTWRPFNRWRTKGVRVPC